MKKFLAMLMVVAMVSFLFVGCMPSVTPDVDDEVDDEVVVAKTDTPFITVIDGISLSATTTQYVSALETAAVTGVGVAGAIIKVYINDVQSGVGSTGLTGAFGPIPVSMITLTDGVKKLYITATVPGLAESDKSTEYTFTYDKTAPTIASAVADSSANSITVTFNEDVNMSTTVPANSALTFGNWIVDGVTLTAADVFASVSAKVIKITPAAAVATGGTVFSISCQNIKDSNGNLMTAGSLSTYIGVTVP